MLRMRLLFGLVSQSAKHVISGAVALAAVACGGSAPPAKDPARPLGEERAVQVIAGALRKQSNELTRDIRVTLAPDRVLSVDVGDVKKGFGVAYVTKAEARALGSALPARGAEGGPLQVVRGPGEEPILVLYEDDYRYDDHLGDAHEAPTTVAERKLTRDVNDFLVHVVGK